MLPEQRKQVILESWKKKLAFVPKNTYVLQVEALRYFLTDLGYDMTFNEVDDTTHITKSKFGKENNPNNPEFISLKLAVSLYNEGVDFRFHNELHLNSFFYCNKYGLNFSTNQLYKAFKGKIIEQVKLQRVKGEWKCQDHMVRFVDNSADLLEGY